MCFGWGRSARAKPITASLAAETVADTAAAATPSPIPTPSPVPADEELDPTVDAPAAPKSAPKKGPEVRTPTVRVSRDSMATMEPGPHSVGFNVMAPPDLYPGHGFLLLPDLASAPLHLDGMDAGDPRPSSPADLPFVGYYNVPAGPHAVAVDMSAGRVEVEIDVSENDGIVAIVAVDGRAIEVRTDPELVKRAKSGELLGQMKPWPFSTLFLRNLGVDDQVRLDGVTVEVRTAFVGLTNLTPGAHRFGVGAHDVDVDLGRGTAAVWDAGDGAPFALTPGRPTHSLVRAHLMTTQDPVLLRADRLPRG